jgi:hypothetical protein
MEVWVDGPRATDRSRQIAEQIPLPELPPLTEQEREDARRSCWSEEQYARTKFAGEIGAEEWAERVQALGILIESLLREHDPSASLKSLLLETLRGRYRATAQVGDREFRFVVREEVVDDLLEAGKAEALDSMRRIVSVAMLPYASQARVS